MDRLIRVFLLAILSFSLVFTAPPPMASAQTAPATAELKISGAVSTPLVLTVVDLKNMPRKKLTVVNPHDKKTEAYEGVLLDELLRKAGVPQGENLRGPAWPAMSWPRRRMDTEWSSRWPNSIPGF